MTMNQISSPVRPSYLYQTLIRSGNYIRQFSVHAATYIHRAQPQRADGTQVGRVHGCFDMRATQIAPEGRVRRDGCCVYQFI